MKKTLSSRSQKTVKPLSTPKLPFNPTLNSQTPSLTSTLSESPSSLRSSLLSIPFSSIGNTHTHTHTHSLSLSLSHTHTHTLCTVPVCNNIFRVWFTDFELGLQAFVDREESVSAKPWVFPSLSLSFELSISLKTFSQGQLTVSFLNCLF